VAYGTNWANEVDFAIFKGFEPYPYGYKFANNHPKDGILYGLVWYNFPNLNSLVWPLQSYSRIKVPWNKWDIFWKAFDISNLDERQQFDAFESLKLNQSTPDVFGNWNCYWLSLSSAMKQSQTGYLGLLYPNFNSLVGSWFIWNKVLQFSNSGSIEWDKYSLPLEDLFAMQLSQYSHSWQLLQLQTENLTAHQILETIKNTPWKPYLLWITWTGSNDK
jgi:hypothetical protein